MIIRVLGSGFWDSARCRFGMNGFSWHNELWS